jgi:hypothetical protein
VLELGQQIEFKKKRLNHRFTYHQVIVSQTIQTNNNQKFLSLRSYCKINRVCHKKRKDFKDRYLMFF